MTHAFCICGAMSQVSHFLPSIVIIVIVVIIIYLLDMWGAHMKEEEQLVGVSPILPPFVSQGLNSKSVW